MPRRTPGGRCSVVRSFILWVSENAAQTTLICCRSSRSDQRRLAHSAGIHGSELTNSNVTGAIGDGARPLDCTWPDDENYRLLDITRATLRTNKSNAENRYAVSVGMPSFIDHQPSKLGRVLRRTGPLIKNQTAINLSPTGLSLLRVGAL